MTSHQISIRKKVFDRLKKLKREDESYSDTIDRLIDSQGNVNQIIECYGIGIEGDEVLNLYKTGKDMVRSQISNLFKEIED